MDNKYKVGLYTVVQRNEKKFLANKLGAEMVMMNMENGDFVSLNQVGADIWELSETPITVNELIAHLLTKYEIEEGQCRNETLEFLNESVEQNIFLLS